MEDHLRGQPLSIPAPGSSCVLVAGLTIQPTPECSADPAGSLRILLGCHPRSGLEKAVCAVSRARVRINCEP